MLKSAIQFFATIFFIGWVLIISTSGVQANSGGGLRSFLWGGVSGPKKIEAAPIYNEVNPVSHGPAISDFEPQSADEIRMQAARLRAPLMETVRQMQAEQRKLAMMRAEEQKMESIESAARQRRSLDSSASETKQPGAETGDDPSGQKPKKKVIYNRSDEDKPVDVFTDYR